MKLEVQCIFKVMNVLVIYCFGICFLFFFQGKLDAVWALFRRGYDHVSLMRPLPGDQVSMLC